MYEDYFYYDETSPSFLRWKVDRFGGKGYKINSRNQKKKSTNTSGITGVYPQRKDGNIIAWVAGIYTDSGRVTKSFAVNKYHNAFELACQYREKLLNENPEYSTRHGT